MAKEVVDRLVALVALVALCPLLAIVALAVKLGSPGPVLFRQQRVGRGGRVFTMLKFRTMRHEAPGESSTNVSPAGDPRVTHVGRLLRSCYLDELPQLVNVLRGDMSLVGPRPETPEFVAMYSPEERRVLGVKPGMAGPSTLAFMDEAERLASVEDPHELYVRTVLHERVSLDLEYLERGSVGYDMRLLARQVIAILRGSR